MTIGQQIGERRKFLRYTQKELAKKAGLSITRISLVENDMGALNYKNMVKVAEVLRCTYQETLIPK